MEDIKAMLDEETENEDVGCSRDRHLDFDMFDYIYSLVSTVDAWEASLSPLDHPLEKFDKPHINKRHKFDCFGNKIVATDETSIEHPRCVTDTHGEIVLYSDREEDFTDIKTVCEMYKFKYEGPTQHDAISYYWEWSFKIYVPMLGHNYPMLIEDYFDTLGIPLEKVMHKRWVGPYRTKTARLKKVADEHLNEVRLNTLYDKAVKVAWQRGDIPLTTHWENLMKDLQREGITYKKTLLKNKFMSEFEDDEFDEEPVEKLVVTELF